MIKQEKNNRLVIVHKTKNFHEENISFGKKLIDVFYPEVIHLELPPLTEEFSQDEIKALTPKESISLDDLDLFSKKFELTKHLFVFI
jgi:hypothetical protein